MQVQRGIEWEDVVTIWRTRQKGGDKGKEKCREEERISSRGD